MNPTLDPVFTTALRRELVALPNTKPRRTRRRVALITAGLLSSVTLGATAVAGFLPADEVAHAPLAPPVILNGVGPANVVLPEAPKGAAYLRVELTCFDGTRCHTPGGGNDAPDGTPRVQRDALPLTDQADLHDQQNLAPLTASGLPIDVDADTHWRLYAVYTDRLNPEAAPLGDGRMLGIPSNRVLPDLVPAVATNGKAGWVSYHELTDEAHAQLTDDGTSQAPIPVYDADGTTVIGTADVSRPYR